MEANERERYAGEKAVRKTNGSNVIHLHFYGLCIAASSGFSQFSTDRLPISILISLMN